MEMKWTPIIDGDLNGIPRDEDLLFTVFDEEDGETYVISCWIEEEFEDHISVTPNGIRFYNPKDVKAWMDFPPPYKAKKKCYDCNRAEEWCDEFGDRWLECKFHEHVPITELKLADCPLNR